ncbi:TAT-variant-translocated molybdopterin oxidoreductase [Roseibacillus ishigakijimensis]|uniref:TAT-variant-translocated molybdopterin oxidoreductase n=1 Tax=Roseibacillus ishigakijimensis TaxID=454146 RepID=A0A934RQ49_9BACT|nr:TAT-variant-translocated molybdopterin oxidoreductase [Roseibacillus ishigakijimensis]MBK1834893.1 TAT-variant-translocated molybdopterin oxidoreductase [Roseibacillus ishigakijimensis]
MSKRVWNHPEVPADELATRVWRSPGELEGSPLFQDYLDREFPEKSGELTEEERELSRRNFVKLMGASSALAGLGLASCRRPETYIVPYTEAPEWVIPGKALYYASAMPRPSGAVPLVVTTFEGRPTKLEPNTECPDSDGTDAFVQASILNLYDPFRSKDVLKNGKKSSRQEFDAALVELAKNPGKIGFVFGEDDSPTRNRLVGELKKKFAGAQVYRYEALESGNPQQALGEGVKAVVDFSKADRILSFDCDFTELDHVGAVKPFFDRRQGGSHDKDKLYAHEIDPKKMNRLYQVEAAYSLTGGIADHRLRTAPSQIIKMAAAVAAALGVAGVSEPAGLSDEEKQWVKACAADLQAHEGKSAVLAGSRHSVALHQLVAAINKRLRNLGADKPVKLVQTGGQGYGDLAKLAQDLDSGAIETVVLLTPANPVYDTPADLDFKALLAKAKTSLHWGLRTDATAYAATWHLPAAHYLESWGDSKTATGHHALLQPLILPLYDGVGELELLNAFLNEGELKLGDEKTPSAGYDEVRKTFDAAFGKELSTWSQALQMGFAEASYEEATLGNVSPDLGEAVNASAPTQDSLDVIFASDASVWDGRYIDNSWLQEAPDPISKLTWDNVAYVSPKTAKALGISDKLVELEPVNNVAGVMTKNAPRPEIGEGEKARAHMVDVTLGDKTLKIPVLVSFGLAENTIVLPVGYGQAADDDRFSALKFSKSKPTVGLVGVNSGFNVYPLRTAETSFLARGAKVANNTGRYPVALTQEHHAMYGRALAREISTNPVEFHGHEADYKEQLKKVKKQGMDSHMPPNKSIYKPNDDKGQPLMSDKIHQWAMAIDLNVCTGCNACLVACQAENNIPVVGKEQVAKGREMHWIRMDRYYAAAPDGNEDNPEMIPQPVACVQCELAPCETVCPVNATVHTEEGLNAMAYNRCIGTRYCANNCPYKARRFNFFDYNKRNPLVPKNLYKGPLGEKQVGDSRHLQRNPNVSVRMRGVMEKCTYCVQRLEDAKIKRKQITRKKALGVASTSEQASVSNEDLRIKVDSVKVACQSACSANAITFGNKLDGDKSSMVRAKNSKRNYDLLNYIGTLPRTSYLARVKNPNDKMPDAKSIGRATINIH